MTNLIDFIKSYDELRKDARPAEAIG